MKSIFDAYKSMNRERLVEDVEVKLDAVGSLYKSIISSKSSITLDEEYLTEEFLTENARIDWLKSKIDNLSTEHDPMADHTEPHKIIDFLASIDPAHNKQNTLWLTNLYKNKQFKQEDAYKIQPSLELFAAHKGKLPIEKRDLNAKNYPSFESLQKTMEPYKEVPKTNAEAAAKARLAINIPGKHELKYDDDKISIYHLKDKDTSIKLYNSDSRKIPGLFPTEWCTATDSESHNAFTNYLTKAHPKSKLFVIHRKSDGAVFQYHPHSGQFMDKNDSEITPADYSSMSDSLHKAWYDHNGSQTELLDPSK